MSRITELKVKTSFCKKENIHCNQLKNPAEGCLEKNKGLAIYLSKVAGKSGSQKRMKP